MKGTKMAIIDDVDAIVAAMKQIRRDRADGDLIRHLRDQPLTELRAEVNNITGSDWFVADGNGNWTAVDLEVARKVSLNYEFGPYGLTPKRSHHIVTDTEAEARKVCQLMKQDLDQRWPALRREWEALRRDMLTFEQMMAGLPPAAETFEQLAAGWPVPDGSTPSLWVERVPDDEAARRLHVPLYRPGLAESIADEGQRQLRLSVMKVRETRNAIALDYITGANDDGH